METLTRRRCRARLRLEQSVDEPRRAADLACTLCVICQEFGHIGKSCFDLRKYRRFGENSWNVSEAILYRCREWLEWEGKGCKPYPV